MELKTLLDLFFKCDEYAEPLRAVLLGATVLYSSFLPAFILTVVAQSDTFSVSFMLKSLQEHIKSAADTSGAIAQTTLVIYYVISRTGARFPPWSFSLISIAHVLFTNIALVHIHFGWETYTWRHSTLGAFVFISIIDMLFMFYQWYVRIEPSEEMQTTKKSKKSKYSS